MGRGWVVTHFQFYGCLCGAKGAATADRKDVDCPKCLAVMETERSDEDLINEALAYLGERDFPEAMTLLRHRVETLEAYCPRQVGEACLELLGRALGGPPPGHDNSLLGMVKAVCEGHKRRGGLLQRLLVGFHRTRSVGGGPVYNNIWDEVRKELKHD